VSETAGKDIAALEAMSPTQIVREWRRLNGAIPPPVPTSLLARDLAHRAQVNVSGGPDKRLERRVRELVTAVERGGVPPERSGATLATGTQLLREWGGKTHRVSVEPDGRYAYAGQSWSSLSVIARTITGARWSGPRFFGTRS
jgi:hypothetical protein